MTYQITVTNTGSLPGTGVEVVARVPAEMQVTNTDGPTKTRVDGQNVLFPALDALPPKQTATYTIEVSALRAGDVRFQAELRSSTLREPVIKQESTISSCRTAMALNLRGNGLLTNKLSNESALDRSSFRSTNG